MNTGEIKITEKVQFHYPPILGGMEVINAQYGRKNFSKHTHDTYTISLIEQGGQCFYRSGQQHYAPPNSIILVNADDVHTGQAANGIGWRYNALYPTELQFQQLAQQLGWTDNFAPYFTEAVVEDAFLVTMMKQMFYRLSHEPSLLAREEMVNQVLTQLILRHGKTNKNIQNHQLQPNKLLYAKDLLLSEQEWSLEALAKEVGLSSFYLVRQFQQTFGLPPFAYLLQHKIAKAKQLLKSGMSVLDTSTLLNFHDQSHFHRHFKKIVGVTPGYYSKVVAN